VNDATATPFRAARPGGLAATLRLLAVAALLWVSGCASAPSPLPRVVSQSLDGGSASAIGRTAALLQQSGVAGASTTSTVVPLGRGEDAWAARLMLAERAERSLDVQYYIFRSDASGRALLAALERAAARGVRVRLLLDDWGAKPDAATLQQLAAQPGFEVRLYNPLAHGGSTVLSLLLDFERTQRRMHNKLLVADGRAAIAGGRNVGDEYFARRPGLEFGDLDLLAVGPVVPQLAAGFDRFWNESPSAVVPPTPAAAAPGNRAGSPPAASGADLAPDEAEAWRGFERRLLAGTLQRYHAASQAVQDLPDKADPARADDRHNLGHEIARVMGEVRSELLLVSPYFVPGAGGVEQLRALRRRGVRVAIVTNTLAATDVPAVHAGYARYRRALLEAGVELHELRADPAARTGTKGVAGSSRVSLHAKVMVVDRRQVFVGSMNIDPRSVRLNSENGLVVASTELAVDLATGLQSAFEEASWRLVLEDGRIVWQGRRGGVEVSEHHEPGAGLWLRLQATVLSWLPIESLL